MGHRSFGRRISRSVRRSTRRVEKDVERGIKSIFDPSEFTGAAAIVPDVVGDVGTLVSGLVTEERANIAGRLERERLTRLRQRGLVNTIITGNLGAPVNKLGLSTEIGTTRRTLLGG